MCSSMRRFILTWLFLLAAVPCITADEHNDGYLPQHNHIQPQHSINDTYSTTDINDLKVVNGLTPTNYRIRIQPFLEEGYFQGQMNISILCVEVTKNIILLTNNTIQVHEAKVRLQQPASEQTQEAAHELQYDQISSGVGNPYQFSYGITLTENLIKGATYEMQVTFIGSLSTNNSEGFFVGSYVDQNTQEKRWYAAIHDAQHAFPCLNESIVKATFELSVVRPDNMIVLSNMPVQNTEIMPNQTGLKVDHFQKTPLMAMSSVAVVLTDLSSIVQPSEEMNNVSPVIKAYGRDHLQSQLQNAADIVAQYMTYFQNYFGVPYPLPNLDIVVLPQTLSTPVNLWGVIILQEDVSLSNLHLQFELSSEIMKQWIIHLTTPVSKTNGVYAALTMLLALDRVQKMPQVNNSSNVMNYLDYDYLSVHSLYYEFGRRYPYASILSMKKAVRVQKAYCALKMLNFTLTERTFKGGVRKFMQDRQYKVFTEDDLFSKWTEQAREDGTLLEPLSVQKIMWAWLIHDRFPVVTITRNYDDNTANFEQHMLLRDKLHDVPNARNMLWWIPIQYLTQNNLDVGSLQTVAWMKGEREMILNNLPEEDSFIIVNPDEIGMFMVNYDLRNWNMISEYMQKLDDAGQSTMGVKTRVKLLHDAWNLAYAGELNFGAALNMTLFLNSETKFQVWDTFFTMVDHVGRRISGTYAERKFSAYVCQLLAPLYESLQRSELKVNINENDPSLIDNAKHTLCYEGYRACVNEIRAAYKHWMDNPDENSYVIGRAQFCNIIKWGTTEEWEFTLQRAQNVSVPKHEDLLTTLASCTHDEARMERLLNVTFLENSTLVTDDVLHYMLIQMTNSAYGYTALFNFLWKNWDAVKLRCVNNPPLWEDILETAVSNFKTQHGLDLVTELLESKISKLGMSAVDILRRGIRKAKAETEWSKRNLPVIEEWLDEHLDTDNILSMDEQAITGEVKDYQLPNNVVPTSYRIQLQPFFEEGHFVGVVHINVTCQNVTDTIKLHTHDSLRVLHAAVRRLPQENSESGVRRRDRVIVSGTKKHPSQQWYGIVLARNLTQGESYEVELSFSGSFVQDLREAFYLRTYEDQNTKEKRWFTATQMKNSNARRVFPCFDSPTYKTTFELSIIHPSRMTALSNMPIRTTENVTDHPEWVLDHFQMTPLISISSVAVVLTELGYISPSVTQNDIPRIRVFGQENTLSNVENATNTASRIVSFFHNYLNASFPLPELNIVLLPESSGFYYDNYWGIIIYMEDALSAKNTDILLSTEITKQWFGHLTTPLPKYDDEHINTALYRFIANAWLKDLNCKECYIPESWDHSLYYEYAYENPLVGLESQKESIQLSKTIWVLKMLNYTVTENTFKKTIWTLLQNRQFKMYTEEDVFETLTQQAHEDGTLPAHISVSTIVDKWMKNNRFPVVTVTRNYDDNTANIEQHMFLRYVPKDDPNVNKTLWWIPIQYLNKHNLDMSSLQTVTWMEEQKQISINNLPDAASFIILNPQEIGMFMVNYDHTNWHLLSVYLQESSRNNDLPKIDVVTREKLLHDSWNLAIGGELNFGVALDMTLFLPYEQESSVLYNFMIMLDHVGRRISATTAGDKLEAYVCQLFAPMYNSLKEMEVKDEKQTLLLLHLKSILCSSGYRPCIDEVRRKYRQLMDSPNEVNGTMISAYLLCDRSSLEEWQFALQKLLSYPQSRDANTDKERFFLLKSLAGCPNDENRIERMLNIIVLENNGTFNEYDQHLVFNMLTGSTYGITGLLKFVEKNWDAVKQRCADKPGLWHYITSRAIKHFKNQAGLDLLTGLYNSRKGRLGSVTPILEEALRTTKARAEWSNENLPVIEQWIDAHLDMNNVIWY